ncbi:Zinc finger, C3HC-like [Trema orientale]|uniref:Zinc finger, C3HC-like n=1 Tax=Trema orientale TaxID=63057 RepID=A0A2P5EM36_TREOI|nr:Zinc finger, C3HC-like [Trema orientale]
MTDDSQKRFHSIMDKLFHAPNSSASSSSNLTSRGKKRANPSSALALVDPKTSGNVRAVSSEAPVCRPWDRGDLMRRLATFKSMTWFAKPEVVSAINCARRGWINVDMDTIACEACGARLLFSTPLAWNQHQVEKMAAVFSLKLDKGHKLLCPWIDNVCDEMLAQFPPTPPPVLVEKYKERCSALLQLSALPTISSSAFEYMKCPQLEQILEQSLVLEYENGSADISRLEYLADDCDVDSEKKYYQAQKLISLCGWEPRLLPYMIDTGHRSSQSLLKATSPTLVANGQNNGINVLSTRIDELTEANENSSSSYVRQSDPSSVVLDCRLCGASVGLWAFSTVPRPMEMVRVVGYGEINSKNHSGTNDSRNENNSESGRDIISVDSDTVALSKERRLSLNLTIAGGPPPTKQNFKATISLPVIGRNLRARFCYDSEFRDRVNSDQEIDHLIENGDAPGKENDTHRSLEEIEVARPGTLSEAGPTNHEIRSVTNSTLDNFQDNMLLENLGNSGLDKSTAGDPGTNVVHGEDTSLASSHIPPCLEADVEIEKNSTDDRNTSGAKLMSQGDDGANLNIPVNNELVSRSSGKDLKRVSSDKEMEFDPIWQHRHFCPWIASTGKGAPGWQQTLSALQRQQGSSPPSSKNSPSASIIKVDDPITSVRNLFMSPSAKRTKLDLLSTRSTQN